MKRFVVCQRLVLQFAPSGAPDGRLQIRYFIFKTHQVRPELLRLAVRAAMIAERQDLLIEIFIIVTNIPPSPVVIVLVP